MSNIPLNDNQDTGQPANDAGYAALMAVKPGERLKKARKERKLDLEAAAEQLNLSVSVLSALEADDYGALPSTTFIKGYIRSYARMLRLPGDDLVRAFEYQTGAHSAMDEQHPVPEAQVKKKGRFILLGLLLLVVAVVVFAVFSGKDSSSVDNSVEVPVEAADVELEAESVPVEAAVELTAEPVQPELQPESLQVISEPEVLEAPVVQLGAETLSEPVVEVVTQEPEIEEQSVPDVVAQPPVAVPEKAPLFEFNNTAEPVSGTGELVMTFSSDCWVEIRDENERLIHADLHRNGSTYIKKLPEPFDVKLGDGNAVQVSYNGSPITFALSKRSKVARFTIGKAE